MIERRASDDCGAIFVMGVFFAVFMTGILFYVSLLADSVLLEGQLQNAADVAAFGTAVAHANGMNAIVTLNQVMSALLAILVGLKLTEMLAALGIALASSFAFVPGMASLIPPLVEVQREASLAYQKLESPVHSALKTLHGVEVAIANAVPPLAADAHALRGEGPRAAAAPGARALPLESDDFSVLCRHAAEDAASVALAPLRALGLPGEVLDPIEDSLGDLAVEASNSFCGKPGAKPPRLERTVERVLPRLSSREKCEAGAESQAMTVSAACSRVDGDETQSAPSSTGECRESCELAGPFEERVQKAREQCDPRAWGDLHGFQWSERTVVFRRARNGQIQRVHEGPMRLIREPTTSRVVPCGTESARYSEEYEPKVHPDGGAEVAPLCVGAPKLVSRTGDIEVVEVVQVLKCVVTEKKVIEMKNPPSAGNAQDESPLRVRRDAVAGSDPFRIHGVAAVESVTSWKERIVEATAYARALAVPDGKLRALSGLDLAEAEYGFDGTEPHEEWMWTSRWSARLARVRTPEKASVTAGFIASCEASTALHRACRGAGAVLAGMASRVAH